ncbi:MAG: ABC transporter ATP-binding protein [Bacteroidetes bacterium]|nr:ABC transporter ATP-binding protein [Bacteroidota bacterium]
MPLLAAEGLRKTYPTGAGARLVVLDSVDLAIAAGEVVAVVGESGSGKSTLLHILGTLDRPDAGRVLFKGEDVFSRNDEELAAFRNRSIGFVFQFHHLLPEFTAIENVAMPALIGQTRLAVARRKAADLLERLGLGGRMDHRPGMLSGGEQQRVAVARALMNDPDIILADEPTGNLDSDTADMLQDEMIRLSRETGRAFIVVTHSAVLASQADRVLRIHSHRLTEDPLDQE